VQKPSPLSNTLVVSGTIKIGPELAELCYLEKKGTKRAPEWERVKFHADGELKKRGKRKEKIVQREALC
jgi:hypothetical protein